MDTADEAAAIAALLPRLQAENAKLSSVLLVTSAFHMPRAAQHQLKQAGLKVLPYSVDFKIRAAFRGDGFSARCRSLAAH